MLYFLMFQNLMWLNQAEYLIWHKSYLVGGDTVSDHHLAIIYENPIYKN